ncbi:MAG: hypothetical protein ACYSR4_10035 [Planctomycetota bacterium]|jgi:hypothetical protein
MGHNWFLHYLMNEPGSEFPAAGLMGNDGSLPTRVAKGGYARGGKSFSYWKR